MHHTCASRLSPTATPILFETPQNSFLRNASQQPFFFFLCPSPFCFVQTIDLAYNKLQISINRTIIMMDVLNKSVNCISIANRIRGNSWKQLYCVANVAANFCRWYAAAGSANKIARFSCPHR